MKLNLVVGSCLLVTMPSFAQMVDEPVARLVVGGLEFQARFGDAVDISGDALVVSAPIVYRGDGGVVWFYRRTSSGWELEDLLWADGGCIPPDGNFFCALGYDVAVLGDRALLGSFGGDFTGGTAGLVYIVEHNGGDWHVRQQIRSPQVPGDFGFGFGHTVAQSSRVLAVGGNNFEVPNAPHGAVFLYEQASGGGHWTLVQTLLAPPQDPDHSYAYGYGRFGFSIAMTEDLLVVGEPIPYGRVHVYEKQGSAWARHSSLYKPQPAFEDDGFGYAVAIDPLTRTIVVGDPLWSVFFNRPGMAHVFEYDEGGDSWAFASTLHPAEPATHVAANDRFGRTVSAHSGRILVGGELETYLGQVEGSAELFEKVNGSWVQVRRYALQTSGPHDATMGRDVALEAGTALVGAVTWSTTSPATGAAFVYEESWGTVICPAAPNSTGKPAELNLLGSPFAEDEDFTLAVHHAPPDGWGVFALGHAAQRTPFGSGALCLDSPFHLASGPTPIGSTGSTYLPLDFDKGALLGLLVPGSTWTFQVLFRDPGTAPPTTNSSSAVEVTFR